MNKTKTWAAVAAVLALAGTAYYGFFASQGDSAKKGQGNNSQGKPVTVATVVAQQRDYAVKLSANGVVSAINTVEVRPQVSSTIAKVHIKEGQSVRAGELLFTLDHRADEVALTKAQAQLDKELATLADQERQMKRSNDLVAKNFLAQSVADSSRTVVQAQQAVVAGAKATVAAARVSLSYSKITAPTSGRTGIINVYPGSLVQPGGTTPLVTITQMNPITITFPLPQRHLSDVLAGMKNPDSFVLARLPDSATAFKGKLQFVDNVVDAASGTVKVKAVFDNKEMTLWPGAYASIELSVLTLKDAIVVPQDAIIVGTKANSVYLLDAEGKAQLQQVQVVHNFGAEAVVTGIAAGAKVIREGKQNLRPGAVVKERVDTVAGEKASGKPEAKAEATGSKKAPAPTTAPAAASAS